MLDYRFTKICLTKSFQCACYQSIPTAIYPNLQNGLLLLLGQVLYGLQNSLSKGKLQNLMRPLNQTMLTCWRDTITVCT